jgi:hypothetical protein
MASKTFSRDAPVILVGASIQLKEEDEPLPRISLSKLRDTLDEASTLIRKHLQETAFASYSLSAIFANDLNNSGMLRQRFEGGCFAANCIYFDIDEICAHLTSLSVDNEDSTDSSWKLNCKSCRTYAFGVVQGFNICKFGALWDGVKSGAPFSLGDLDYMSLACLLSCRSLMSKLEKVGFDIGLEIYIVFRSGEWLYLGYDDVYQEGVVICEREFGLSPFSPELVEAISSDAAI